MDIFFEELRKISVVFLCNSRRMCYNKKQSNKQA